MRLGSGEHYGWEEPRTVRLIRVFAGAHFPEEYAWLHIPDGAKGGPLDVMVAPRTGDRRWGATTELPRVDVAAWVLTAIEVARLKEQAESGPWNPPKPNPDLWLYVERGPRASRW
ncbi:MAG: hypothetical protein IPL93_11585 [Actinomycetales bacterium]|jgi:hypothetical protein|nr:hypothetical protein [Actinomycetales bacterium]